MRPRRLGRSDLVVRPIGLNAASFAAGCGPADPAEATEVMSLLLETDNVLVDATGVESVIREAVCGRRDRVVLASRPAGGRGPAGIVRAAEASLRGLGTDHLDLCYLDGWRLDRLASAGPLEARVAALAALVEAGKVRHIGLFDVDADQLRRACAVHPVAVVAAGYSLLERTVEAELLPAARSLGVGLAAYRPLGRGALTGPQVRPDESHGRDPTAGLVVRTAQLVAARRSLSVSRLALAWLLSQGDDIVALPATRSVTHLEMNLAAAGLVLSPADRAELNSPAASPASGDEPTTEGRMT